MVASKALAVSSNPAGTRDKSQQVNHQRKRLSVVSIAASVSSPEGAGSSSAAFNGGAETKVYSYWSHFKNEWDCLKMLSRVCLMSPERWEFNKKEEHIGAIAMRLLLLSNLR